jgi:hypothetical protein
MCRVTRDVIDNEQNIKCNVVSSAIFFYFGNEGIYEEVYKTDYRVPSLEI